jgi:hypothetical protein
MRATHSNVTLAYTLVGRIAAAASRISPHGWTTTAIVNGDRNYSQKTPRRLKLQPPDENLKTRSRLGRFDFPF